MVIAGSGTVGGLSGVLENIMFSSEDRPDDNNGNNSGSRPVQNDKGEPYPQYTDPRTGEPVPFPEGDLEVVSSEDRVVRDNYRYRFIKEWNDKGYEDLDWSKYDIHHIKPIDRGGTHDFWNLVPVERGFHQSRFNSWWANYKP